MALVLGVVVAGSSVASAWCLYGYGSGACLDEPGGQLAIIAALVVVLGLAFLAGFGILHAHGVARPLPVLFWTLGVSAFVSTGITLVAALLSIAVISVTVFVTWSGDFLYPVGVTASVLAGGLSVLIAVLVGVTAAKAFSARPETAVSPEVGAPPIVI